MTRLAICVVLFTIACAIVISINMLDTPYTGWVVHQSALLGMCAYSSIYPDAHRCMFLTSRKFSIVIQVMGIFIWIPALIVMSIRRRTNLPFIILAGSTTGFIMGFSLQTLRLSNRLLEMESDAFASASFQSGVLFPQMWSALEGAIISALIGMVIAGFLGLTIRLRVCRWRSGNVNS